MKTYEELEKVTDDLVEKVQEAARDLQLELLQGTESRDERIEELEGERDAAQRELEDLQGRVYEYEEKSGRSF